MWNTSEIKERGRAAFKLNYWKCVLVSFILGFVMSGTTSFSTRTTGSSEEMQQAFQEMQESLSSLTPGQQIAVAAGVAGLFTVVFVIALAVKIFLYNPLKVGGLAFFKQNVMFPPADLNEISVGFKNYMHTFVTLFLNDLFLTLWTMLLIVPGIIKSYSYRMVPYILADEPDLSPTDTITRSRQMMDGHKWHAFCYDISFIGWFLLTIITCGIVGLFWYGPYKNSSDAALYLALRGEEQPYPDDVQTVYPEEPQPVYPQEVQPVEAEEVQQTEAKEVQPAEAEEAPAEAAEVQPAEAEEAPAEAAETDEPAAAEEAPQACIEETQQTDNE